MSEARRGFGSGSTLAEDARVGRDGEAGAAVQALRRHVDQHPDDAEARLRFARLLASSGDPDAARRACATLEAPGGGHHPEAQRILAELDEAEGALGSAAERWERILADDIDDAQARTHLARLRPERAQAVAGDPGDRAETLVSPEGVETLRYRLVRELGRGATATVYLARDEALGIELALKVLHPQLAGAGRSEALRRFFREARLAGALRHPGVIAVYDVDEPARALAMEWIPGGTLRVRLRQRPGGLPAEELEATARGLLGTLEFLHAAGIVHGDLKPTNLLLREPGTIVLADFGAAELIGGPTSGSGAAVGGTPLYLAPEQFRGAPPSPATDLYAAGAILFEMATGRPLRAHAELLRGAPPESVSPEAAAALDAAPSGWQTIVLGLLDADPNRRTHALRGVLSNKY